MAPVLNYIPSKARMDQQLNPLETPTSEMARMEVKSRTKRPKLASSKSLTQLVPRSLFFLRRNVDSVNDVKESQQAQPPQANHQKKKLAPSKLVTCRSFPAQDVNNEPLPGHLNIDDSLTTANDMSIDLEFDITPEICDRMDRLKSWPRKPSIHNTLRSKIFGDKADDRQQKQAPAAEAATAKQPENQDDGENGLSGLGIIFNPQKGRFLFMRGNRFVQQRCRSKQPFARLTNELATPSPTKLYSPFDIETPETDKNAVKSKRKLNLDNILDNKRQKETPNRTNSNESGSRLAQLKLANRKDFTNFVSPTGKFRETINYVEQSQRDIEAISKAIMTRSALNSNNNLNGSN